MKNRVLNAPLNSMLQDSAIVEELQQKFGKLKDNLAESVELGRMEGLAADVGIESAAANLETLLETREAPQGRFAYTEAIILLTGRPALLVRDDRWDDTDVELDEMKKRLQAGKDHLLKAIPRVGRIDFLNHPTLPYGGTGWMIEDDVLITNRHVASIFGIRESGVFRFRTSPAGASYQVVVDFNEEFQSPNAPVEVPIEKILFIEQDNDALPDMALVRLRKNGATLPGPIELSDENVAVGLDVAVIGYPARDPMRNDPFQMQRIFKGIYEVKRLSPGKISGTTERGDINHDCSTLGGNSGSVVLSLETGKAVGLHFAGSYRENNYAVTSRTLRGKLTSLSSTATVLLPSAIQTEAPPTIDDMQGREGYNPNFLEDPVSLPNLDDLGPVVAPLKNSHQTVLNYNHFSIAMHKERRMAIYTACNIEGGMLHNIKRSRDAWYFDPRMDKKYQVGNDLYAGNPLDRGHLVRRLDPGWGDTRDEALAAIEDTFFFTNCAPQHEDLNQKTWLSLEDYVLSNAATHELKVTVFTGPVFGEMDSEYRDVYIPQEYWKVVVIRNRDTERLSATGYLLSQTDLIRNLEFVFGEFRTYQVPVGKIQEKTGIRFGNLVDFDPIGRIEAIGPRVIRDASDLVL